MLLTAKDCQRILEIMREHLGPGYAEGEDGKIQAKLSMMVEAKTRAESS